MNPNVKEKFVKALKSGKYVQGTRRLKNTVNGQSYYCCIGVLCDVHRKENHRKGFLDDTYMGQCFRLPKAVIAWASLEQKTVERLMRLNDIEGWSFRQIADYIEKYL